MEPVGVAGGATWGVKVLGGLLGGVDAEGIKGVWSTEMAGHWESFIW